MKKQSIKIFEAFAGIGAQYYALKKIPNLNIEVVGISEWDFKALKAYRAIHYPNIQNVDFSLPYVHKELQKKDYSLNGTSKIDTSKLSNANAIDLFNTDRIVKNIGSVQNLSTFSAKDNMKKANIFIYSFPCQDLATGGKGKGMKKGSGTRSGLLWELEKYLKDMSLLNLAPDILLLENVRTIYSPAHRDDLNLWLDFLKSIGYTNNLELMLNALDYGLPQNRNRAFIISIKQGIDVDLEALEKGILSSMKPRESLKISDFVKVGYDHREEDEAWLNKTRSREKMWDINQKEISENPKLGTITCNLDRSNNSGMFKYKDSYRLLTMRESFALMGFGPEVYDCVKKLGFSYRQINKLIGNSIAVNVLEAIFQNILKYVSI
jgi:DNA (cytosine-5)-methyltransferase 1